jgi:uncharacterized BrkB/YihY/UPF0761 family membrane protein
VTQPDRGKKSTVQRVRTFVGGLDEKKRAAEEQIARQRERRRSVQVLFGSFDLDRRTGGSLLAGGIAYRLFLWLLPFALFSASVVRLVSDVGERNTSDIAKDVGMNAAMISAVAQASDSVGRNALWLLCVGLFLTFMATGSLWKALRAASALAWGVTVSRPASWIRTTALVMGALFCTLALQLAFGALYGGNLLTDLSATLLVVLVNAGIGAYACLRLPHPDGVSWLGFVPGALFFAVGSELLRLFTAIYLAGRLERVDELYGALGISAVFMGFLYLTARLMVAGLALNAEAGRENLGAEAGGER